MPGSEPTEAPEHVDVLIVGAGIAGINAAYHLTNERPGRTFVVLDALEDFGGTWLTHRFPGVRSDTELFTLGYGFKPWTGAPYAKGSEIHAYLGEVIEENDLGQHIRYGHKVLRAAWDSARAIFRSVCTVRASSAAARASISSRSPKT